MGVIGTLAGSLLGGPRNIVKETAEVFRENAEESAQRDAEVLRAAMAQFAAEFALQRHSVFDRFMDAANRLPRPALALGTLGLFVSAMYDPVWFAERMQGIAVVPEPLWWLLGVIVSFYFGSRYQVKSQDFQRSLARSVLEAAEVAQNVRVLRGVMAGSVNPAATELDAEMTLELTTRAEPNPALEDWRHRNAR